MSPDELTTVAANQSTETLRRADVEIQPSHAADAPGAVTTLAPEALAVDGVTGGRSDGVPVRRRRRRRSGLRRIKRWTVKGHRWLSFSVGIVLVVITTAGALIVFAPEWTRWTNSSTFEVTDSEQPISMTAAMKVVADAHPEFDPASVNMYSGLYEVMARDGDAHPGFYGVDPGSGRITGYANPNSGVMAFMEQVHECFFTCDDYPGYVSFLNDHVPTLGMHWLHDVTWAGFILGVCGLLLVFLGISGIWLWWPSIKRLAWGFKVRTKKGRFARDYDLHQVIGIVAIPFLLMWGLTGASFEFHWVSTAWYTVTGGQQEADSSFASNEATDTAAPDIGLDAAIAAGRAHASGNARLVYVSTPDPTDATAYYDMWFSEKFDQYRHGAYPGQLEVTVDRHDAAHIAVNDYGTASTLSNKLLDRLGSATFHYGQSFNGWWRIFWFVFGLTPLALMITAISTWFAKRKVRKRRRAAADRRDDDRPDPLDDRAGAPDPALEPAAP